MLSPVAAVSVVGAPIEKPVVATAETSGVQTAATPLAVLSSGVNASVEGKLNMLLVAARERMFESLLSAIDAASVALNVPREPDESNVVFAQRLADAIRSLPPQQLAAAQQQLNAQVKTPVPLPLLAAALDNPDSPQAVQIAISLDTSLTQEPDAVIRAVVNSYGQNAGEPDVVGQQQALVPAQTTSRTPEAAANTAMAAPSVERTSTPSLANTATAVPTALPEKMAAPSLAPVTVLPSPPTAQTPPQTAVAIIQTIVSPAAVPVPEAMPELEAVVMPQTTPDQPASPQGANVPVIKENTPPQIAVIVGDKAFLATSLPPAASGEAKLPTEIALIRSPSRRHRYRATSSSYRPISSKGCRSSSPPRSMLPAPIFRRSPGAIRRWLGASLRRRRPPIGRICNHYRRPPVTKASGILPPPWRVRPRFPPKRRRMRRPPRSLANHRSTRCL